MTIRSGASSKDLIYGGCIVDSTSAFPFYEKKDILNRVQYWKDYFAERSITTISMHFYQCLDCIAIILACMENGITIYTGTYSNDMIDELANTVDLTIVGFGKTEISTDRPKFLNANHYHKDPVYIATEFKLNSILIKNVADSNRVFSNLVEYTVEEFILASKPLLKSIFSGGNIATIQYTMHHETLPMLLTPLMIEQSTIYSCSHMIELASLLRTQGLDYIVISPTHLQAFKLLEDSMNKSSPFGAESFKFDFDGARIITARSGPQKAAPSAEVCDWLFSRGVDAITALYIPDTSLTPIFSKTIRKTDDSYFSNELGDSLIDYTIENNKLWAIGRDTGNYVAEYNNRVFFKGNRLINNQYIADVQQFMIGIINSDVTLNDFVLNYVDDTLYVYSFRKAAYDTIANCAALRGELLNFAGVSNIVYKYWDRSKIYNV